MVELPPTTKCNTLSFNKAKARKDSLIRHRDNILVVGTALNIIRKYKHDFPFLAVFVFHDLMHLNCVCIYAAFTRFKIIFKH
eukprot:12036712-Ditylum_brightwellii.AAC.1